MNPNDAKPDDLKQRCEVTAATCRWAFCGQAEERDDDRRVSFGVSFLSNRGVVPNLCGHCSTLLGLRLVRNATDKSSLWCQGELRNFGRFECGEHDDVRGRVWSCKAMPSWREIGPQLKFATIKVRELKSFVPTDET